MTESTPKDFCPVKNIIIECLARINLSSYEWRVVMCIFRKTYGWSDGNGGRKTEDFIANSQIVEFTGMHKAHVSRALGTLVLRKIVTKGGNKVGINKKTNDWLELPKGATTHHPLKVTEGGTIVTKGGNKKLPKGADTKETKETIQKKLPPTPKRVAPQGAEETVSEQGRGFLALWKETVGTELRTELVKQAKCALRMWAVLGDNGLKERLQAVKMIRAEKFGNTSLQIALVNYAGLEKNLEKVEAYMQGKADQKNVTYSKIRNISGRNL